MVVPDAIVIAPTDTNSHLRLIAVGDTDRAMENRLQLLRYVDHAAVSLRNATQFDAIPRRSPAGRVGSGHANGQGPMVDASDLYSFAS